MCKIQGPLLEKPEAGPVCGSPKWIKIMQRTNHISLFQEMKSILL